MIDSEIELFNSEACSPAPARPPHAACTGPPACPPCLCVGRAMHLRVPPMLAMHTRCSRAADDDIHIKWVICVRPFWGQPCQLMLARTRTPQPACAAHLHHGPYTHRAGRAGAPVARTHLLLHARCSPAARPARPPARTSCARHAQSCTTHALLHPAEHNWPLAPPSPPAFPPTLATPRHATRRTTAPRPSVCPCRARPRM